MKTPIGEINDKILELVKDEEMTAKMAACKTEEECYELVKDRVGISFEDFKASMKVANSYLKESEAGLLNEEELDQVAGGKSTEETTSIVGTAVGGSAAIVGAGAAVVAAAATAA